MYIYEHTYTHLYIYEHTYTHEYVYEHTYTHVYIYEYTENYLVFMFSTSIKVMELLGVKGLKTNIR